MNTILFSALLGVVMMFSSFLVKKVSAYKYIAVAGLLFLLIMNIAETSGYHLLHINTRDMLRFDKFGLFFNTIAIASTLVCITFGNRY